MYTEHEMDKKCSEQLLEALKSMRASKPNERSEKARRYVISITELEKLIAYFDIYVVNDAVGYE